MGAGPDYRILDEDEIQDIGFYGEFVELYELANKGKPLTKTAKKKLGLTFLKK